MGCLYNREEHVLAVVLGRKEVLAPAAQLVRCARPAMRLGLRLVAASSLRLRLVNYVANHHSTLQVPTCCMD